MLISEKQAYLAVLIFSSILAWASFFSVIFLTNPSGAGVLGITILYASAAVGLASLSIILWQIIKQEKKNGWELQIK